MIDRALTAFLERGCAIITGTVGPDGVPHAHRGWGCTVVDDSTIRVLLDATDQTLRTNIGLSGGRIAITGADVRTLRSVQLKGTVVGVEPPGTEDLERCAVHNDELFTDILETDLYRRELSERMVPPAYLVALVRVEDIFDQTPGPAAGASMAETPS